MSIFVEFILPEDARVEGLQEQFNTWAGKSVAFDPPRYEYRGLVFTLVPVARHVSAVLPAPCASAKRCLELDEKVVLAWSQGQLPQASAQALRRFLSAAARAAPEWATVYDPSFGPVTAVRVEPSHLFDRLGECLAAKTRLSHLTVFVVRESERWHSPDGNDA